MPQYIGPVFVILGVKLVGYSFAASIISQAYHRSDLNSLLIGSTRVVLGAIGTAAYIGVLWCVFPDGLPGGGGRFVPGLIPVRLFEWSLLVWLIYDRRMTSIALDWKVAVLGTVWSFALDICLFVIAFTHIVVTRGGLGV